jgi:hypothetical protein
VPGREVHVLERERRQRGRPPGDARAVERRHLLEEHAHRPLVRDDVVRREDQAVVSVVHLEQRDARERAVREVERAPHLRHGDPLGLALAIGRRRTGQVDDLERHARAVVDVGARLAPVGFERGPEDLMA